MTTLSLEKIGSAAAVLLAAQFGILWMDRNLRPAPAVVPADALEAWPKNLSGWVGEAAELDQEALAVSGAKCMRNLHYRNAAGEQVALSVAVWSDYYLGLPHSPEECYSRAGWEVTESKPVAFESPSHRQQAARLLTLSRKVERTYLLYWYQLGDQVALDSFTVRKLYQSLRVRRAVLPPMLKIMVQANCYDSAEAEARLLSFAPAAAAEVEGRKWAQRR